MCRLRKQGKGLKSRLENAEKLFKKSYFLKVIKNMTPAAKIFTSMQYFQVGKKPTGRRFSTEEKVLSLSLYKRSPKCYGLMSKYFVLPSTKSLKRLLAQIKLSPGINKIIFDKLKKTVSNLDTEDRLCTLIFDEMSIMPQIHYDSSSDELKGFSSNGKNQIANHALVFMVKGIKKHYKQPVAYFFTNALNKIDLKSIIKDVINNIQKTGLIILCTVCDQSTVNVGAIEGLIKETKVKYLRKGKEMPHDMFEINRKKIIPLYDVPHLLKGLRNNLLNKTMTYIDYEDGNKIKSIKWEYFQQLYAADKSCGELSCLQKLTEEHIVPDKIKKMRVKTAAQIFSHSVAVTTDHLTARGKLPEECRSLIPITVLVDNLFDSLNCNTFVIPNGKIYKGPVRWNSPHHQLWLKAKKYLKSIKFQASKKVGNKIRKFETVVPSVKNFVKTIEGIQELWKILSQKYSFDSMLTRNFNQDPVENFFGSIRNCGARNIAPNVMAFEGAFKTVLLNNLNAHSAQANCEEDDNSFLQSLHFFTKNTNTAPTIDFSEKKEINLREEVLKDVKLPNDLGQRNYVCGWILRKCLKNIIKNCKTCRKTVLCSENDKNSYIAAKEYFPDKMLLCYPSKQLEDCFLSIQSICVSHLKSDVLKAGLKKEIKTVTEIFVQFPFKCETHKEKLKEYFTDVTINIIIYSWCKSINRILAGKLTFDGEDETKMYAQDYYNKHRHNKNNK